ncbi:MAG: zinc-binding dehydrogenase [Planctomycetes bacterium]|nr:zinc-binding dehydrogenase [Planctomycetota bacterium]
MKALTLTRVKAPLELLDRPRLRPAPGQAIVRLKAAALNRRDYWITQGLYPAIQTPVVLGSDGSGVVSECGEGVDRSWLNRDVIIDPGLHWGSSATAQSRDFIILGLPQDGTFATEVAVDHSQLHDKPDYLSWQHAAALPLAGVTAYRAVFVQGRLSRGETLLITGIGGGVATFALQFALAAGAEVWVSSSSQDKIDRAIELGARGGVNYRQPDWAEQLAAQGIAPHLIIDSAGGPGYDSLIELAAPGGRIVNYGATAGPPEKLDLFKVFWKQLRLQGSTMGSPQDFLAMIAFASEHKITPVLDATFSLSQGNEALTQMASSPQFGKYVLTID